jgi:exopolysaccharide biosynthesis polyprenyl glycosylphosphotransferase
MVALLVFMFLAKFVPSRLLVVSFLIAGIGALWLERTVLLPLIQRRARQPIRNLIVIGSGAATERFAAILQTPAYHGSRLIGYIADEEPGDAPRSPELRHLGGLGDLESVLDREVIDEVMIVRSQADLVPRGHVTDAASVWSHVLELCLQRGRTVSLVDDMVPPVGAKVEATMMGTLPTLVLHNTPQDTLPLALKSLMDRVIAFFALLVLTPLVLVPISIAIKLTAPGPIFFRQKRVGLNGRQFWFYKFRSMINDAEKFKEEHPELFAGINTMSGPFFKSEDDPRITKVGRFLRKYSLDELPQFWNVLRGDMSIVGPRPPLPREVEQLEPWQRRKLSVKGGLTCLWQVSGRNEIDTDEWMRLDLEYIDNWSLWLDVKLLFKTLKVLDKPKGAS